MDGTQATAHVHGIFLGLTESIIAAAASRIGKTVLHLDKNDYYGGFWASFNLEALQGHAQRVIPSYDDPIFTSEALKIYPNCCHINNIDLKWPVTQEVTSDEATPSAKETLLKASRHFNIDLWPTLLYSNGAMVKLLISSNICRYVEFRALDRVATLLDGAIKTVPCSRSDVFVSSEVNVVEKRIMMKLIETCMELKEGQEEYEAHSGETFQQFLQAKRAPAKVQHYLVNALSMATAETPFSVGLKSLKKFVESLGRYGNSPFLFPMYGCGEIPQCFCRLCAVFGGIYCLQRGLKSVQEKRDGKITVQLETGEDISVENIVFGPQTMRASGEREPEAQLARGILIVDQPLKDTNEKPKGGGVELLRLTSGNTEAYLIQLSHYSGCCPKDVFLYQLITTTNAGVSPREALQPFIEQILPESDEKPKILFELFFTIPILHNQFQVSGREGEWLGWECNYGIIRIFAVN